LERERLPRTKRSGWSVRVTDIGGCPRKVYYRNGEQMAEVHGGEHATMWQRFRAAPEDKRAARLGVMIHDRWQDIQRKLYPWRVHEIELLDIPGLDSSGRPDDFDPLTGRLRQCKTAGAYRWEMTYTVGVADYWLDAECIYAFVLERDHGYEITDLAFTIIERADGADITFVFPWDDAMRARGRRSLARLATLRNLLDKGIVPARGGKGPTEDKLCGNCFARRECWGMTEAEALGVSPESYIRLGSDPDENAMAEVLADVVAAMAAETETKKHAKQAKVYIEGRPLGRYGEYEIVPGRAGNPDYKSMLEDAKTAYRDATGRELVIPERRQKRARPSARRVSAAQLAKEATARAERPDTTPVGVA
jgi:hypothetical protein